MILDWFLGLFSTDMGIDLGTANTLVTVSGQGIVLNEPSVVAVRKGTNQVLLNGNAVGAVAKAMLAKTPPGIQAIRPMKSGRIADFDITEAMLSYFIRKVHDRRWGVRPRVVVAVPSGITAVEKRAVFNSAERAGARKVYLISEPRAAGIGAGLPVDQPVGSMVVDIGGGTTEIAVLSLAEIVCAESLRVAGDDFDEAIVEHVKRAHNLHIGEQTAERIKIAIGSCAPLEQELEMDVRGRDTVTGLPRQTTVTSEEIREALLKPVGEICAAVRSVLERTGPELAGDLVDNGLVLCGGSSQLRGLDRAIARETGLPVRLAEDPMTCVARGTAIFLENLDRYAPFLESEDDLG
ncbi:MAG: rod shape-determining protein [Planctomycetota bacterium]|nr:MAG: rod shape-determining protein [Planctomycetota bacterium]